MDADHNFSGTGRVLWLLKQNKELLSSVDGVAFHYYDGIIARKYSVIPTPKCRHKVFLIEKSKEKGDIAILINPNEEDKLQVQFKLNGIICYAELPPASISTIY